MNCFRLFQAALKWDECFLVSWVNRRIVVKRTVVWVTYAQPHIWYANTPCKDEHRLAPPSRDIACFFLMGTSTHLCLGIRMNYKIALLIFILWRNVQQIFLSANIVPLVSPVHCVCCHHPAFLYIYLMLTCDLSGFTCQNELCACSSIFQNAKN